MINITKKETPEGTLFTMSYAMTDQQRIAYQDYLADFDPSPIGNGEDYIYPLSEDAWLEEQEDKS